MKPIKVLLFSLATIFFLTFSHSAVSAHAPDLHEGVSGSEVTELQVKLQKLGYFHVAPTGYYGSITKNAVIQFQRDFGVSATGFTGPMTREKLNQVDMMARTVHGEARGEIFEGKVAVAAVIMNRVQSSAFPSSTYGVIFQRNAFTAVNDGQYYFFLFFFFFLCVVSQSTFRVRVYTTALPKQCLLNPHSRPVKKAEKVV